MGSPWPGRDGAQDPSCAAFSCMRGVDVGARVLPGAARYRWGRHVGLAPFHCPIPALQT